MVDKTDILSSRKRGRMAGKYQSLPVMIRFFMIAVVFPTLMAIFYYLFMASDIYVAEAKYAIRSSSGSSSTGLLDSIMGPSGGSDYSNEDGYIVRDYILSRDMLEELDQRLNLRQHYAAIENDTIVRLGHEVSVEDFLEYYQDITEVIIDPTSDISTIRVRAFDAVLAKNIAENILQLSEQLVNKMSDRIVTDSLKFAQTEVNQSEARVKAASAAVTAFRSRSHSIDPGQETSAVLGIVTGLESSLAQARAELIEGQSVMRSDSPQVKNLSARVNALEKQVKSERKRLISEGESKYDYTRLIDNYEPLVLEQRLAEQRYTSALTSLEVARADAQRKQRYLIAFVKPKTPDEPIEPEKLMMIITILIGCSLFYGISGLVWAAIKDHMRI